MLWQTLKMMQSELPLWPKDLILLKLGEELGELAHDATEIGDVAYALAAICNAESVVISDQVDITVCGIQDCYVQMMGCYGDLCKRAIRKRGGWQGFSSMAALIEEFCQLSRQDLRNEFTKCCEKHKEHVAANDPRCKVDARMNLCCDIQAEHNLSDQDVCTLQKLAQVLTWSRESCLYATSAVDGLYRGYEDDCSST